jgi:hypothetical protein
MSSRTSPSNKPNARTDSAEPVTTIPDAPVAEVMSNKMLAAAGAASDSEIAIPTDGQILNWDDDTLQAIASFDDALRLLADTETPIVDASQVIGNGFAILNDKAILQGIKVLFLSWRFNRGDMGVFASVNVIAQMPGMNVPGKFILNDGSTGICRQLVQYTSKTGRWGGLMVSKGLRRSDYQFSDPTDGSLKNATTYYLDTSA